MPAQAEEKSREVRLGLVMYGGVSLAIYINGVAQEFFRAVHGSGLYRLIKLLTDSDILVDIISGTSAGGINGILLGYALANDKDFSSCAQLWRDHGAVLKLLRKPDEEIGNCISLLDSEGYYQPKLADAFRNMPPYNSASRQSSEDLSEVPEIDLFVTGTDFAGRVYTQIDDAGHPIDVKDHRAVFWLKYRKHRVNHFAPPPGADESRKEVIAQALGKLARITSCFPAAFSPVPVGVDADAQDVDGLLRAWGALDTERAIYFLDGGVLDNKPFTHTIRQIYYRTADKEVDRKLFYVEPDPEQFEKSKKQRVAAPNLVEAARDSLIAIPGYESIADDLKLLAQHNSRIEQYRRVVGRLGLEPAPPVPQVTAIYRHARLTSVGNRALEGVLRVRGRDQLLSPEQKKEADRLTKAFEQIVTAAGAEIEATLSHFDLHFRVRRLFRVVDLAYEELKTERAAARYWDRRRLCQVLNRQIKLLEIIRAAMEDLIDRAAIEYQNKAGEEVWNDVQRMFAQLLSIRPERPQPLPPDFKSSYAQRGWSPGDWLDKDVLSGLHRSLKSRVDRLVAGETLEMGEPFAGLLELADSYEAEIFDCFLPAGPDGEKDPVRLAYETFGNLDAHVFPIEFVSGLQEKDPIETVRISPRDAQGGFCNRQLADKVCGDAFGHFGGFLKRSWRSNDILWGRLDCLCQLTETLLNSDRLKALLRDERTRRSLRGRVSGPDFDPKTLFPRAGERTQNILRERLSLLLSDDERERGQILGDKDQDGNESDAFREFRELLIQAAQLEIIADEVPGVIRDAIAEQAEWNRYRLPAQGDKERSKLAAAAEEVSYDSRGGVFRSGDGDLDPLVVAVAAEELARRSLDRSFPADDPQAATPRDTRWGRFFVDGYRVGSEDPFVDIPRLVLLEMLARALLVFRNCVLNMFGSRAAQVREHLLYRFAFDYPLRVFYSLVRWLRGRARRFQIVLAALLAVAVVLLAIGILGWSEIIRPESGLRWPWAAVFFGLPALILIAEFLYFLKRKEEF